LNQQNQPDLRVGVGERWNIWVHESHYNAYASKIFVGLEFQYAVSTYLCNKILGWYIPLEIDDRRWRDSAALEVLHTHIQSESSVLRTIGDKAVYISSFFAGNMSPQSFTDMLESLKKNTSINILVQDGRGTGKLSMRERKLYLSMLNNCQKTVVKGIVFEI
jgi:hypothetical protein